MWFIWFLLKIDEPRRALSIFIAISKVVVVVLLALAGVVAFFAYLATVAADGPQCSGYELIERYRPIDFVGLFLACSFIAFMVWRVAWPSWRMREQLEQSFERDVQLVHSSSFVQMTDGILTAYFVLLALLGASALLTGIAITHYLTILNDCQLVIAPHR